MFDAEKDLLRNNSLTSSCYMRLRTLRHSSRFHTYNEKRIKPIPTDSSSLRVNLVLPVFYKSEVFGGINTALRFFKGITAKLNCESRIIISGEQKYSKKQTYEVEGFEHNKNLFFIAENERIEVRKNDIFMCTSWLTAYYFFTVRDWQSNYYQVDNKIVYLIQDYEPGFYPWSTEYALADSTYTHTENTIAVFNSKQLYDFFISRNYKFFSATYFTPYLNEKLKQILIENSRNEITREKVILLYARPVAERNAFGIIHRALRIWDKEYEQSDEWTIIALGDRFTDIQLENSKIHFKGKLTIEDYGKIMLSAYCGISLMISPHPSYPPLEMSTFGVKTITNSFECKDLADFNDNIISIDGVEPVKVADKLIEICKEYGCEKNTICLSDDYLLDNSFGQAIDYAYKKLTYNE